MSELDKIYCVFEYDSWDEEIKDSPEVFFFSKEAAEVYARLCKLKNINFDYQVVELECRDHMMEDYKIFVRNLEEEKKIRDEAERVRKMKYDIKKYARLKTKLECDGSLDSVDIEKELLKKHGLE